MLVLELLIMVSHSKRSMAEEHLERFGVAAYHEQPAEYARPMLELCDKYMK